MCCIYADYRLEVCAKVRAKLDPLLKQGHYRLTNSRISRMFWRALKEDARLEKRIVQAIVAYAKKTYLKKRP